MEITQFGLYCIDDTYFEEYKKNNDFKDNKRENRPNYCTFIDSEKIIWLIPMSSQVETYTKKIEKDKQHHKECIFYHIGKVNGTDRVFLIGKMFPVTVKYIKRPYTYQDIPYVIENKDLIKQLNKRSKKYLALVKNQKIVPDIDIMKIKRRLLGLKQTESENNV